MPEIIQALILGIVQGVTEFIPVSSSGHLVIVPWLFGWEPSPLLFDTILHWGTLAAIIVVFWRDFWRIIVATVESILKRSLSDANARLGWYIVLGTIPAAVLGLLFADFFEALVLSEEAGPIAAGFFLLVTAALLIASELVARNMTVSRVLEDLNLRDALFIGVAQALALFPGISRSGSTIAAGLTRKIRRDEAARFSFYLGAPTFLGAGLLQLGDALATDPAEVAAMVPELVVGFLAAAVTGVLAIRILLNFLRMHSLYPFAIYCIIVGLTVIGLNLMG